MTKLIRNVRLHDGYGYRGVSRILIDGSRIMSVEPEDGTPLPPADAVIDGGGAICLPGLSNAHTHAAMTLVRGMGSDLRLREWLKLIWPTEPRLSEQAVYWGSMLAIMEMVRRGITSFADMYKFMPGVARAVADSGARACLADTIVEDDGRKLRENIKLYRDWQGGAEGRINVFIGLHAEYTTTPEQVSAAAEAAGRLGTGVHIHLSETDSEVRECGGRRGGLSPVTYFDGLGLFGVHTLAAHCVSVNDEDIALLAERGVWVAHNPVSNLKLASGIAPVSDMQSAGVNLAIGTDSVASNNQYDMFAEMRLAALLQKGVSKDPTRMRVDDIIRMATVNGARAMGFEDVGAIAPGMRADIIMLDPAAENLSSLIDPATDIVYSAQGLNVIFTMVDGNILYDLDGFHTIDAEETLSMAKEYHIKVCGIGE